MSLKAKIISVLIAAIALFSTGTWVGYQIPRGEVDPQDYIETVFTPVDNGIESYLKFLSRARQSVYISVYAFTDARIADKLIELKKGGVKEIRVILDKSQTLGWSGPHEQVLIDRLRAAGIEVVIGTSAKSGDIMHLKCTIVDMLWVEDGSWNYTKAANDQDNNLNFIRSPKRAKKFKENWDRMYAFMKAKEAEKAEKAKEADDNDSSGKPKKSDSSKKSKRK